MKKYITPLLEIEETEVISMMATSIELDDESTTPADPDYNEGCDIVQETIMDAWS